MQRGAPDLIRSNDSGCGPECACASPGESSIEKIVWRKYSCQRPLNLKLLLGCFWPRGDVVEATKTQSTQLRFSNRQVISSCCEVFPTKRSRSSSIRRSISAGVDPDSRSTSLINSGSPYSSFFPSAASTTPSAKESPARRLFPVESCAPHTVLPKKFPSGCRPPPAFPERGVSWSALCAEAN